MINPACEKLPATNCPVTAIHTDPFDFTGLPEGLLVNMCIYEYLSELTGFCRFLELTMDNYSRESTEYQEYP